MSPGLPSPSGVRRRPPGVGRWTRSYAAAAVLLTLCLVGCTAPTENATVTRAGSSNGYLGSYLADPYVMPDRTLTDTKGGAYNLATSPSKPVTLVFFGYTKCPDVCIGVLADVASALNRMEPADRDQIDVVFVTTDPKRDTGPVIAKYLRGFDDSFVGLTGDLATIKSVADQVGVGIEGIKKLPSGGYDVGHSAQVTGFDKQMHGVVLWTPGTPIADLRHDFTLLVSQQR